MLPHETFLCSARLIGRFSAEKFKVTVKALFIVITISHVWSVYSRRGKLALHTGAFVQIVKLLY